MPSIDVYRLAKSLHQRDKKLDPPSKHPATEKECKKNRENADDAKAAGGRKQKQKEPSNKWASITRAEKKFDVPSQIINRNNTLF